MKSPPTLPRASPRSFHPLSRADPLVFVFDTSFLYGRGILKRVGPCAHNPPGLQPERIGPWETDHFNAPPLPAFRAWEEARGCCRPRDAKIFQWKESVNARGPRPSDNPGYQSRSLYSFAKETIARAHAGKLWFSFWRLSRLLVVEGSPGVVAENCSLRPSAQTYIYHREADFVSNIVML